MGRYAASVDDLNRQMAKVTLQSINLRLRMARDEKIFSIVLPVCFTVAAVSFLYRGEYGFGALLVYAAFIHRFVVPRNERAGRRAGWGMAWMNVMGIVTSWPVEPDMVKQLSLASNMDPSEDNELAQARLVKQQLEQMLGEDPE